MPQANSRITTPELPHALPPAARAGVSDAVVERDPILALIEQYREQHAAAGDQSLDDDELTRRMGIANATWWKVLDTGPCTLSGAIAYAEFVASLEDAEEAPTNRVAGDDSTHTDVCKVALGRIAACLKGAEQ